MAAKGMILLDEIRGRLAEVFSLKTYKIDHVIILHQKFNMKSKLN